MRAYSIDTMIEVEEVEKGIECYTFYCKPSEINEWSEGDIKEIEETKYSYVFLGLEAGKEYDIKVIAKDKEGNEVTRIIDKVRTNENTPPTFKTEAYASSINTNSITISTVAEDEDGDKLIYTLYWGETSDYEKGKEDKKTESGEGVEFVKNNLNNYTPYYWKIEVSDGNISVNGTETNTRTYCTSVYCKGYSTYSYKCGNCNNGTITTSRTCTTCNGTGKKKVTCGKVLTNGGSRLGIDQCYGRKCEACR